MGAATARELARRGFHVLAVVRRDRDADAIRGPGIEPLIIDITNRTTLPLASKSALVSGVARSICV